MNPYTPTEMAEIDRLYAEEARILAAELDREAEARQAWDDAQTMCPHTEVTVEVIGYEEQANNIYVCSACGREERA